MKGEMIEGALEVGGKAVKEVAETAEKLTEATKAAAEGAGKAVKRVGEATKGVAEGAKGFAETVGENAETFTANSSAETMNLNAEGIESKESFEQSKAEQEIRDEKQKDEVQSSLRQEQLESKKEKLKEKLEKQLNKIEVEIAEINDRIANKTHEKEAFGSGIFGSFRKWWAKMFEPERIQAVKRKEALDDNRLKTLQNQEVEVTTALAKLETADVASIENDLNILEEGRVRVEGLPGDQNEEFSLGTGNTGAGEIKTLNLTKE